MPINDYLVVFSSHINSDSKKEFALETLKHLNDNNIDVCISTHCNKYLEELSIYSKFITYDYNNELVTVKDFLDNIDLINESCDINGSIDNFFTLDYTSDSPVASRFIPGPEHSKSALILLRNGVQVAYSNHYRWVIYLEYDLPIPIGGYKKFIEEKISILENNNKECFYYISNTLYNQYLWGGCVICKTDKLFSSKKLMTNNWNTNIREWIKCWGITPFEYCIRASIYEVLNISEIYTEIFSDVYKEYWNVDNYLNLSRSDSYTHLYPNTNLHLYPVLNINNKFDLYFLMFNFNVDTTVHHVQILVNNIIIYEIKQYDIPAYGWLVQKIEYKPNDHIELKYNLTSGGHLYSESFYTKDIETIYKYMLRMTLKKG